MVNKAILIGNLGRDPELTYTQSGTAVCKVSIATTDQWTSRDGEKQEDTQWHNLVFWRRQAEVANEYLRKGSRIYIEGRIKYRSWESQDGTKRYATDIEVQNFKFLSTRGEAGGAAVSAPREASAEEKPAPADGETHYEPLGDGDAEFGSSKDDDLPF